MCLMQRYIYFIAIKGYEELGVKVGCSTKPQHRLQQLQYMCPGTLYIIHSQLETREVNERSVHRTFEALNTHGEWFQYTKELSNYIASLLN